MENLKEQSARRKSGRPSTEEQEQVRESIIAAAAELFACYNFRNVSVRQIADHAKVSVAMVAYYFNDKNGLLLTMYNEIIDQLAAELHEIRDNPEAGIEGFIRAYSFTLKSNPWFAVFISKEIYFGEGDVREEAIKEIQTRVIPLFKEVIESEIQAGKLRSNLDPMLLMTSIAGLAVYPFIIRKGLPYSLDDPVAYEKLIDHTINLFLYGASMPDRPLS